jgi:hypothetical protein
VRSSSSAKTARQSTFATDKVLDVAAGNATPRRGAALRRRHPTDYVPALLEQGCAWRPMARSPSRWLTRGPPVPRRVVRHRALDLLVMFALIRSGPRGSSCGW